MQKAILALVIPILILVASFICFLMLNAIGAFQSVETPGISGYLALSLPICVYLGGLIVWAFNQSRKDFVPIVVALFASGGFLLGASILTNFVGLGINPSPVLELFFSSEGLNRTLPYFFGKLNEASPIAANKTIASFLIIPIGMSIAGVFIGSAIQQEKPNFRDRIKQAGIRFAGVAAIAYLLFFPIKQLLTRS